MAILNNSNAISPSGYDINNSLRFRSSASAYLNRTPASATNRKTWTWSAWVKLGLIQNQQPFFSVQSSTSVGSPNLFIFLGSNGVYAYQEVVQTSTTWAVRTSAIYRDPSAWYHVVVAVDTTQATSANRVKIYVNGIQQSSLAATTYPSLNYDTLANSTTAHNIGRVSTDGSAWAYADGYMAEVNFIDGQALTPSSFGSTNATTGVWQPIKYTGTYGTNGFYLNFSDIATTSGSNAGLGKDFSGNTNYWTTNNISVTAGVTYDAMIDSPTLTSETVANYAVMNPLGNAVGSAPATLSDANLTCKNTATSYLGALGTIGLPTSGKFYWEVQLTQNSGPSNLSVFGIAPSNIPLTGNQANYANSIAWYMGNTTLIQLPSSGNISISGSGSITTDVFQICYDGATGKVYFGKNNTFYNSAGASTGNPSSGTNETATLTTGDLLPWFFAYQEGAYFNFGQRPFSYTPPTGFVRLNTYNLPNSTIVKGNTVMDATLYTGTGSSLSVTNAGSFQPDLVWVKGRSGATDHAWYDSVRGTTKQIESNNANAETTEAQGLTAFGTGGFTVGTLAQMNTSAATYVGWQWQAGQGTNTSNTSGTITSTVSVNTTAGFSVLTYTGTGANATVGHGLGVAPKMIIVKDRTTATNNFQVYHASIGNTTCLRLNLTNASAAANAVFWNNTSPTSSVFSLGTYVDGNQSGDSFVAYCWAEIAGFSKFGSYTGNGNANGPFVYTGFRPKWIMIKCSSAAANDWPIIDTTRATYNVAGP
jgi:hypothetical protein